MPDVDRKFTFTAISQSSGNIYTEQDAVVFLARDPALPAALEAYYESLVALGAGEKQLDAVVALLHRVRSYQTANGATMPVVETEAEAYRLVRP